MRTQDNLTEHARTLKHAQTLQTHTCTHTQNLPDARTHKPPGRTCAQARTNLTDAKPHLNVQTCQTHIRERMHMHAQMSETHVRTSTNKPHRRLHTRARTDLPHTFARTNLIDARKHAHSRAHAHTSSNPAEMTSFSARTTKATKVVSANGTN